MPSECEYIGEPNEATSPEAAARKANQALGVNYVDNKQTIPLPEVEGLTKVGEQHKREGELKEKEEELKKREDKLEKQRKNLQQIEEEIQKREKQYQEEEREELIRLEEEQRKDEHNMKDLNNQLEATRKRVRRREVEITRKRIYVEDKHATYSPTNASTATTFNNLRTPTSRTVAYKIEHNRHTVLHDSAATLGSLKVHDGSGCLPMPGKLTYYTELDVMENHHGLPLIGMSLDELRDLAKQGKPVGHVYYFIFLKTNAIPDLEEAVRLAEGRIPNQKDDPDYELRLRDLIVILVKKYERTTSPDDLQEAIYRAYEMTQTTPHDHPDRAAMMGDWMTMILNKSSCTGLQRDIDQATVAAEHFDRRDNIDRRGIDGRRGIIDRPNLDSQKTLNAMLPAFMTSETDKYAYEPLLSKKIECYEDLFIPLWNLVRPEPKIRLLHLFPGIGAERLSCSLEILEPFVDKKTFLPYEAISYTWGGGSGREDIACDGKFLNIGASLAAVLRRFRLADKTRVLWADGICINQEDKMECGHQVMLMAAIYSQADQVLCWLGEDEGNHAKATFSFASQLSEKVKPHLDSKTSKSPVRLELPTGKASYISSELYSLITFTDVELENSLRTASMTEQITCLFSKPWFSRMWIRQEIGYASKALVACGDSEIDWTTLKVFNQWAKVKVLQTEWVECVPALMIGFDDFHDDKRSFLDLLIASRDYQSTDARDKVFALLAHPSAYEEQAPDGMRNYSAELAKARSDGEDEGVLAALSAKSWSDIAIELKSLMKAIHPEIRDASGNPDTGQDIPEWATAFSNFLTTFVDVTQQSCDPWALPQGPRSDAAIANIESMGFPRLDIGRAMRAAYFDPDRAAEYLLTGIPESALHVPQASFRKACGLRSDGADSQSQTSSSTQLVRMENGLNNSAKTANRLTDTPNSEPDILDPVQSDDDDTGSGLFAIKNFTRMTNLMIQARRIGELRDPSQYAINRARSTSVMACLSSKPIIEADYMRSVEDINHEVATKILTRSRNLVLLHAVQHESSEILSKGTCPSWVPRWDRPILYDYLGKLGNPFLPWNADAPINPRGGVHGNILTTNGIVVDEISFSTEPIIPDNLLISSSSLSFWKRIIACDTLPHGSTSLQKVQLYMRTLIARNSTIDENHWNEFSAFWTQLYDADRTAGDNSTFTEVFKIPELDNVTTPGTNIELTDKSYHVSYNRRIFCTKSGFLGLGPLPLEVGDVVCILPCNYPFVLRPKDDHHLLVGECYVDAIMDGRELDTSKITEINIH